MSILILNGPNLNLQGTRQTNIYGTETWLDLENQLTTRFPNLNIELFQSNHEGILLDKLHTVVSDYQGVVLNAGALSHYSYALADGIRAVAPVPVIEVHLSNIYAREESFRHKSVITPACVGTIAGFGLRGYMIAVEMLLQLSAKSS